MCFGPGSFLQRRIRDVHHDLEYRESPFKLPAVRDVGVRMDASREVPERRLIMLMTERKRTDMDRAKETYQTSNLIRLLHG